MKGRLRINSKGWIIFLTFFILNGWMWWYFRSYFNFAAAVVMLTGVLASLLVLKNTWKKFIVSAVVSHESVRTDEEFEVIICASGRVRCLKLPLRIRYSIGNVFMNTPEEKETLLYAGGGNISSVHYTLRSSYCGRIDVRLKELYISDFFHLAYYVKKAGTVNQVVVFPKEDGHIIEEPYRIIKGLSEEALSVKGADFNADYEIREYVPGDSVKNLHWKLSAKQGRLMLRERNGNGKCGMNVLLELAMNKDRNHELIISLMQVCKSLIYSGYEIKLYYWDYALHQMADRLIENEEQIYEAVGEIFGHCCMMGGTMVRKNFETIRPGEAYVLIETGETKGVYVE